MSPELEKLLLVYPDVSVILRPAGRLEFNPTSTVVWIVGLVAEYYIQSEVVDGESSTGGLPPSTSPPMIIEAPPMPVLHMLQYCA